MLNDILNAAPIIPFLFQLAAGNMPEADDSVERISKWLQERLDIEI